MRQVSVTFEATVILPPKILLKISGDNQTGPAGASLGRPFVVEVRDENRTPLGGIPVTFAVSGGGGSLNLETTWTNPNGRAWSLLTLGNGSRHKHRHGQRRRARRNRNLSRGR